MGLFDKLKEKKEEMEKKKKEGQEAAPEGKYAEACAMCGGTGTEKKWLGQYWHRKCLRKAKKSAKGMF